MASTNIVIAIVVVLVGLSIRLLLMGTSAAKLGFLPEKWQRWFLGNSSHRGSR